MAGQQQQLEAVAQKLLAGAASGTGSAAVASLQRRHADAVVTHLLVAAPLSLHGLLTMCLDAKLSEWAADSPVQLTSEVRAQPPLVMLLYSS